MYENCVLVFLVNILIVQHDTLLCVLTVIGSSAMKIVPCIDVAIFSMPAIVTTI